MVKQYFFYKYHPPFVTKESIIEKNEIYDKIGTPNKHIQIVFENEVCTEVRRIEDVVERNELS